MDGTRATGLARLPTRRTELMKQIERYIFRRMAMLTFWSLVAATSIVLTTQVLIRVDVLTTTGAALSAFLQLAATLIPSVLVTVVPFALLIGVGQVLSGMNADSELVVMEGAGAGPATILKPVLILSAALSIFVLLVGNFVEPWANRKLSDVLAEAQSDLFSMAVRSGTFQRIEDGLHVQINEKLPGGELSGIFLSDTRTEGRELIYFAKQGMVQELGDVKILYMTDGEVQQRATGSNQISNVSFSSYALDLAAFLPAAGGANRRPKEQPTSYLLDPRADDYFVRNSPWVVKEEIVGRFSSWLYPLAFGFIAFTFLGKARSNRQEQVQNVFLVSVLALSLRGFGFYSGDAAGRSLTMEVLSYALPVSAIVMFGFLAGTGRTLTLPRAWSQLNGRLYEAALARFDRFTGTRQGNA